jgi:hypothetical protein
MSDPRPLAAALVAVVLAGCGVGDGEPTGAAGAPTTPADASPSDTPSEPPSTATGDPASPSPAGSPDAPVRPDWLGERPLPLRDDGFGVVTDTPPELRDRRLPPPPPQDAVVGARFESETTVPPGAEVLARSTFDEACPVTVAELAHVTVTYLGFDGQPHRGELLVHRDVADDVVAAFDAAYAAGFPFEEVRIIAAEELDLPPTGDGNTTTAFVCRPVRGSDAWSAHAYGLALDVNPFHNPYVRGDLVLPELATAYTDRSDVRPGMLDADSALVRELTERGWTWGGTWTSPVDPMHLSATGG